VVCGVPSSLAVPAQRAKQSCKRTRVCGSGSRVPTLPARNNSYRTLQEPSAQHLKMVCNLSVANLVCANAAVHRTVPRPPLRACLQAASPCAAHQHMPPHLAPQPAPLSSCHETPSPQLLCKPVHLPLDGAGQLSEHNRVTGRPQDGSWSGGDDAAARPRRGVAAAAAFLRRAGRWYVTAMHARLCLRMHDGCLQRAGRGMGAVPLPMTSVSCVRARPGPWLRQQPLACMRHTAPAWPTLAAAARAHVGAPAR